MDGVEDYNIYHTPTLSTGAIDTPKDILTLGEYQTKHALATNITSLAQPVTATCNYIYHIYSSKPTSSHINKTRHYRAGLFRKHFKRHRRFSFLWNDWRPLVRCREFLNSRWDIEKIWLKIKRNWVLKCPTNGWLIFFSCIYRLPRLFWFSLKFDKIQCISTKR